MNKSLLRIQIRLFYQDIMNFFLRELDEYILKRSAIIFSPHPDDETLGCGGTIIRKKKAGADVNIIFMADGRKSHSHLMSENELKSIRVNEALAASQKLGVEAKDVRFLEFKDSELHDNKELAILKVIEILLQNKPDEIFIPYHKDTHPDHSATNSIVVSALKTYQRKLMVNEYPIWLWRHWPWVRCSGIRFGMKSIFSSLNLLKDFHCSVDIADVLELKRAALTQHRSQMTRLIPDPNWWTLSDVSHGEFLECFFQDHEIYYRYPFLGSEAINL